MQKRGKGRRTGTHYATGSVLSKDRRDPETEGRRREPPACCRTADEHEEKVRLAIDKHLSTPEILDFIKAIQIEAKYQEEQWKKADPEKTDADWYWLIGWLGGKAVNDPHKVGDLRPTIERKLHRIITVAAAAYNWHAWAKKQG